MASTDFFDEDLGKQREAERRSKLGAGGDVAGVTDEAAAAEGVPVRAVPDFAITRMAKHKQEVDAHVASAMEELEKLRQRQEDLERQKKDLEELRKKQEEYVRGKQEMIDRLNQSLVSLEKEEIQANRVTELLGATRKRFKGMLADIQAVDEEHWSEDQIRDELNKASTLVDDVRMEYNKSIAKIEAVSGDGRRGANEHAPVIFEEGRVSPETERSFGYWLKVGLAARLPLMITLLLLAVILLALRGHLT